MNLGFSKTEMSWASAIYHKEGRWVPKVAEQIMGPINVSRYGDIVKYCIQCYENDNFKDAVRTLSSNQQFDDIPQEELDLVCGHFKKMHNRYMRGKGQIFNGDLAYRLGIKESKILVKFRNLEKPYDIYNDNAYQLEKKGSKECIVKTKIRPEVKKERELKSEQASIEKDEYEDIMHLKVKNEYCGLYNRFGIFISLKPPAFHCGCTCNITDSGNIIYIYALEIPNKLNWDKKIENRAGIINNAATCMAYGYANKDLENILINSTKQIIQALGIVQTVIVRPEHTFEEGIEWLVNIDEGTEGEVDTL